MIRSLGGRLALAVSLLLALSCGPLAAQAPTAQPPAAQSAWPQNASDLKPDPAIRFGVLPNGMRYALRRQTVPAGQTALRLWINAGSLMETDEQQGLAHFVEHMAFNGSKAVKEGEMIKILERLGLSFGADTNASTSYSETIYKLDLPRSDAATVDTSLMLLREAASNLTIAPAAVERERGVVLSEERSRDAPGYRVAVQRMAYLLKGQRLPTRQPIGKTEVLKTAPASAIADFYARWYRPERSVLVAAGDFDVDDMEARIRGAFGDWSARGPAPVEPDPGPVAPRGAEARLVVDPGAPAALQIIWLRPPDLSPDTTQNRRRDFLENLGVAVLNRRYSALTRQADPPFQGAGAFISGQEHAAEAAGVSVSIQPGRWREGLSAAEQEARRFIQFGVGQDELDREIEEGRASLRAALSGAATRRPADLANEIISSLADKDVVTSPADDLAAFEASVAGLKASDINAIIPTIFQGQGPLVFMSSPTPVEGGEAALLAALTTSTQTAVTPRAAATVAVWPYQTFGTPGTVAEQRAVADLGATFVRFRNGVRLTVKPTKFRDDEVQVRVNIGSGMLDLPRDRQSPYWAAGALIEGGLGKIGVEDMERVLAAKVYGARFGIADDAYVFSGSTRTGDLPTQLQVLAAYLTDAAWGEAAFQRVRVAGKTIHDQYESTDDGVLARDLSGLLHHGDRRWTFPTRDEIAAMTSADTRTTIGPHLASGPLEVVIVGDVTVDQAIRDVAATFGALPRRPATASFAPRNRLVRFPEPRPAPLELTHKGREDQASAFVGWPTGDFWANPQLARDTAVLREVLRLRLIDQLREAQAITYSPDVTSQHSQTWTGWGYISAGVEAPPSKLAGFFADVDRIAADLGAIPVGVDELARAKKPRLEALKRAQLTNGYWLGELSGAQADRRRLKAIRETIPGTEQVTAADVQTAAKLRLRPERAWRLVVVPQPPQAAARPSS